MEFYLVIKCFVIGLIPHGSESWWFMTYHVDAHHEQPCVVDNHDDSKYNVLFYRNTCSHVYYHASFLIFVPTYVPVRDTFLNLEA